MPQPKHHDLRMTFALIVCILVATFGRIIPHPYNMTPLASLAILSGFMFNRHLALILTLISLVVSDIVLSFLHGYAILGPWTLFTYSGFICMVLFTPVKQSSHRFIKLGAYLLSSSFLYWLWTNWGTWWLSGLYPHTMSGLMACYIAGLPFLRNSVIGNIIYMTTFVLALQKFAAYSLVKVKDS